LPISGLVLSQCFFVHLRRGLVGQEITQRLMVPCYRGVSVQFLHLVSTDCMIIIHHKYPIIWLWSYDNNYCMHQVYGLVSGWVSE